MNNEINKNIVIYSAGVLPYSVTSSGSIYFYWVKIMKINE